MESVRKLVRMFVGFAMVSGVGWLCDMLTFAILVKLFEAPSFVANFISSYAGVTFVWFVSLKMVFKSQSGGRSVFLLAYWGFQFVSILAYSEVLHLLAATLREAASLPSVAVNADIVGKIIITPFNLITNFVFMKLLVRFMHAEKHDYV